MSRSSHSASEKNQNHGPEELRGALAEQGGSFHWRPGPFREVMHGKVATSAAHRAGFAQRRPDPPPTVTPKSRFTPPPCDTCEVFCTSPYQGLHRGGPGGRSARSRMTTRGRMTSAGTFVGRVGGLAAALGVGAAVFGGIAVGWADPGSPDTDRGRTAAQSSGQAATPPPQRTATRSSAP